MSDAVETLARLVSEQVDGPGPKLSFADKCAAFGCLKMGVKQAIVAKAFGISTTSVAYLGVADKPPKPGCLPRYRAVALEFERVGDRAFMEHYVTDAIATRVARIKANVEEPGDDRRRKGPNIRASTFAFENYGAIETRSGELFRIDWIPQAKGWLFVDVPDRAGTFISPKAGGSQRYRGMEFNEQWVDDTPPERIPFPTSSAAYQAILIFTGDRKPR